MGADPSKCHVMLSGESPLMARHDTCTMSPAFAAFSPNENGVMEGGTVTKAYPRSITEIDGDKGVKNIKNSIFVKYAIFSEF